MRDIQLGVLNIGAPPPAHFFSPIIPPKISLDGPTSSPTGVDAAVFEAEVEVLPPFISDMKVAAALGS